MAESETVQSDKCIHHVDTDGVEEKNTDSFDIYDDILFNTPLPDKAEKKKQFRKPSVPPPEEESVDLYSEFMDEKSENGVNDPPVDQVDQFDLYAGDTVDSSKQDIPERAEVNKAVVRSELDGDVDLDLYTEVLTDELQARHDATVELKKKNAVASNQILKLESDLKALQLMHEKLKAENIIMKRNMCSLLLTAKTELKRKDGEIHRLNALLTKKKVSHFWTKQEDPKKGNEMSPGRQRIADVWNKARKSDSRSSKYGDSLPSKPNKNTDTDRSKRKLSEPRDEGTPKRPKISFSRQSVTPDSKGSLCSGKSSESSVRRSEKKNCSRDSKGRTSSDNKSDRRGNKENNSDRNRDRDKERERNSSKSDKSGRSSSVGKKLKECEIEKSVSETRKSDGERKEKLSRNSVVSHSDSNESVVRQTASDVMDLREILRMKREGKSSSDSQKLVASDRKRQKSYSEETLSEQDTVSRTVKISRSDKKLKVTANISFSDQDEGGNEPSDVVPPDILENEPIECPATEHIEAPETGPIVVHRTESTEDQRTEPIQSERNGATKTRLSDCDASEAGSAVSKTSTSVPNTTTCEEGLNRHVKELRFVAENSDSNVPEPIKYSSETSETTKGGDLLLQSSSHLALELKEVTRESLEDTSPPFVRKNLRRIKPIMISGKKSISSQEHDGSSCFDSVIKNIEMRESVDFAKAKVVHVDINHESNMTAPETTIAEHQTIPTITKGTLNEPLIPLENTEKFASLKTGQAGEQSTPVKGEVGSKENTVTLLSHTQKQPEIADEQIMPVQSTSAGSLVSTSTTTIQTDLCHSEHSQAPAQTQCPDKRGHYSFEENEHILLCTQNVYEDKSSTCLSSNFESVASDNSDHECSLGLIIKDESCSRTTPYFKCKTESGTCQILKELPKGKISAEWKNKSKKKKKHKIKHSKDEVDSLELGQTSVIMKAGNSTLENNVHSSSVIQSDQTESDIHNTSENVNLEEMPDNSVPSNSAPKEIPIHVISGDVNQNFVHESVDATVINANNTAPNLVDPKSSQQNDGVLSDSVGQELKDDHIAPLPQESTSLIKGSVIIRGRTVQVPCIDCRLSTSERPPYHVEPFEFTSFPEFYANTESEDEDKMVIIEQSESDKEQTGNTDSSFEMNTLDANKTVICRAEQNGSNCTNHLDRYPTSKDGGTEVIAIKPKFLSCLQEQFGDGPENSSGFSPQGISVEESNNSGSQSNCTNDKSESDCVAAGDNKDKLQEHDKSEDQGAQKNEKIDIDNSEMNSTQVLINKAEEVVKDMKKTLIPSEVHENLERNKQKMSFRQEGKKEFSRQTSLPASENGSVMISGRTRSCSEPQTRSSSNFSHQFDPSQVKACFSPIEAGPCHPIDLSLKSIEKNQDLPSPIFIHQISVDLSCFNISKDGALDLSKKATQTLQKPVTTCSLLSPGTNTNDSSKAKSVGELATNPEHQGQHNIIPTACSDNQIVTTIESSLQTCLKHGSSADTGSSETIFGKVKEGVMSGKEMSLTEKRHSVKLNESDTVVVDVEKAEAMEIDAACSEDDENLTDVSLKSSTNSSLKSPNTSAHSFSTEEGHMMEKHVARIPNYAINNSSSPSDSDSEDNSANQSQSCTSKSATGTQVSCSTNSFSDISSNVSCRKVSPGTSSTSTQSSSDKLSVASNISAKSGSGSSLDSSSDDDSDSDTSEESTHSHSSDEEVSDVSVNDYDDVGESSQSQILIKTLSSQSVQRNFDMVKLDLEISDDSSLSCRESRESLLTLKSSSNVSNDGESFFKLPDMSTSAFAKLSSISHSEVAKSESSRSVKAKSSEVTRTRLSFPSEENSVLSILADSCDGFDCEQDDHKEDCRKYQDETAEETEEAPSYQENSGADDEDGCMEDGELCDDGEMSRKSVSRPSITEEESQELTELLKAKKLLEEKIHGIFGRSKNEKLSCKSADHASRHRTHTPTSSSRHDRKSSRSTRDTREKDRSAKTSDHGRDRYSREIHGSDPRLSSRSSSSYRHDKNETRHKHYTPSSHRSHMEERRDRRRDISPITYRSSYKDHSKENHRREGSDRYPVDGRYRTRPRDVSESERSKGNRSSGSHHSSRRSSRDFRS